MTLDPDYASALIPTDEVDWVDGDAADLRRAYNSYSAAFDGDVAPACRIDSIASDGVTGLLFTPSRLKGPDAIVYFHGGSWVVGSPDTHRVHCSHLAEATGLAVVSVRYGLAPEHRFPRQREDGVRAAEAVLAGRIAALAPGRVFLAGDSAGAAVAFWTDAALSDRARVAGVVGFYGAYGNIPGDVVSAPEGGMSPMEIRAAYARLGPVDHLAAIPDFSIVETVRSDGAPVYLSVGTEDQIADDTAKLAARLREVGRPVTVGLYAGLGHSYVRYVARVPKARQTLDDAARWIGERSKA